MPGDAGLFGPGSEVWRVAREKVLLAGGPAALLLQLAHPLVAAAVAAHSDFRKDPLQRLRATLSATLTVTFGDSAQAREAAHRVATTHRRVRGKLTSAVGAYPEGALYRATDPELAMWVHATLVHTALEAYARLVGSLAAGQRADYYQEAKRFALLFGVTEEVMPADYPAFADYFQEMVDGPGLAVGADAASLAPEVLVPRLHGTLRPFVPLARPLTAAFLPDRLRRAYGLAWGPRERTLSEAIRLAVRAGVLATPPVVRYWPHYRTAQRRMAPAGNEQRQ